MFVTIGVLIVLTIALAAFVLAPRLVDEHIVFGKTPDPPAAFGYRMAWLAIKTTDCARVADVLHLSVEQTANWSTGIGTVYDERLGQAHIYMTPPVNGWIFVVGLALPQPLGGGFLDKCTPMLLDLAGAFPEAQYYLSCPSMDFYAWSRVAGGKLVRAFAIGDEGVIWNKGKASKEEKALGLRLTEVKGVRSRKGDVGAPMPVYPTEAHVMHLAGCWSLDPTTLTATKAAVGKPGSESETPELGYICLPPAKWRPERQRRTG